MVLQQEQQHPLCPAHVLRVRPDMRVMFPTALYFMLAAAIAVYCCL
jgi:hypothetical protein